jgi:hypothetical protein
MNMPNASGLPTHQMTLDHPVTSEEELCQLMNDDEFILFNLIYKRQNMNGETWWQDRGKIIVNTSCIGKVQQFIDFEAEGEHNESHRNSNFSRNNVAPAGGAVRTGRKLF